MLKDAPYWLESLEDTGKSPYNEDPDYKVFRNVRKHFGAVGDGVTDDTDAINAAISSGREYLHRVDSSTIAPALVYFPSGTYLVSKPIVSLYYTQLVGDPRCKPTILAAANFEGIAVVDENPYREGGSNYYTPQNNFWRAVRSLIIDMRQQPTHAGTGIHHQVSQATGLTDVTFLMRDEPDTKQQGIFMENGSGGVMSGLVFQGGRFGMWLGNQQFTIRSCRFYGCQTAIYQHWNWSFVYLDIFLEGCGEGLLMRTGTSAEDQATAGATLTDWTVKDTSTLARMTVKDNGTLILHNIHATDVDKVVVAAEDTLLDGRPGTHIIESWAQYTRNGKASHGSDRSLQRPPKLLQDDGKWFGRERPLYQDVRVTEVVSAWRFGACGDGVKDNASALQDAVDYCASNGKILFIPHGVYALCSTLRLRPGSCIIGEVWPVLLGVGRAFQDLQKPTAVVEVGSDGERGSVELADLIFSTRGPAPGAIVLRWNLRDRDGCKGEAAMWDCHVRIGGAAGTHLELPDCPKTRSPSPSSRAAFLAVHITRSASAYFQNVWVWTADHDLDHPERQQINVVADRGLLCEAAEGPVWLWGQASEHHILYQFNFHSARNVLLVMAQTESPYFLGTNYDAVGDVVNPVQAFHDPTFPSADSLDSGPSPCPSKSWGLLLTDCKDIAVLGAGLYSFFDDGYAQTCIAKLRCQCGIAKICGESTERVQGWMLSTIGTRTMLETDKGKVDAAEQKCGFASLCGRWNENGSA